MEVEDYADHYFDLKFALQDLLGRQFDLLEERGIRNPHLKKNIGCKKQLVYSTEI
ncbi:hypothetical protein [Dyadobacter jiangsuensis]|uniref:hypothetical protein n=1 Tax=Dyadobacter jiangsuensis TaxID=1591085 RepID=UPI001B80E545|nr:hypothetical protein [Dyadobacter jiangsuensis]